MNLAIRVSVIEHTICRTPQNPHVFGCLVPQFLWFFGNGKLPADEKLGIRRGAFVTHHFGGGNEYGTCIIHPTAEAEREILVNTFGVNN